MRDLPLTVQAYPIDADMDVNIVSFSLKVYRMLRVERI